jgi:hypothetical protein
MALSVVQVLLLLLGELLAARLVTGRSRLPTTDLPLGISRHHRAQGSYEADVETTAIITLYQQQIAGYKQQRAGGYSKLL